MSIKSKKPSKIAAKSIKTPWSWDETKYGDFDDRFQPTQKPSVKSAHTTAELIAALEADKTAEIDARVLVYSPSKNQFKVRRYTEREKFLEAVKSTDKKFKLKESKNKNKFMEWDDWFLIGGPGNGGSGIEDNQDFTPLLGGPFFKQLYQYDYMRMHSACFYAWHHDPFARFIIECTHDFVLGKGFTVESKNNDPKIRAKAQMTWDLFAEANKFQQFVGSFLREISVYGEHFVWFLPGQKSKIAFKPYSKGQPESGLIPRVRLIDPSCIWDICTMPDDITEVIFYQWIAPTQYQTYTAPGVPTTKFIFQQIPASEVLHYKINCADDEKRGRSELFSILGYLKRLRDSINYSVIGMQKAAAWTLDTTIQGNQEDLNAYANSQMSLGTVPPAGSEFIHTAAIERQYLANQGPSATQTDTFSWVLSCIAAGCRIPTNYFGTHMSGGTTRASAVVATEPVIKFFESRREILKTMIRDVHKKMTGEDCDVVFPELITQDRSTKLRDVEQAYLSKFISLRRASNITAKELDQDDFEFEKEQKEIQAEPPPMLTAGQGSPLTAPPKVGPKSSAITGDEKAGIKDADRQ